MCDSAICAGKCRAICERCRTLLYNINWLHHKAKDSPHKLSGEELTELLANLLCHNCKAVTPYDHDACANCLIFKIKYNLSPKWAKCIRDYDLIPIPKDIHKFP